MIINESNQDHCKFHSNHEVFTVDEIIKKFESNMLFVKEKDLTVLNTFVNLSKERLNKNEISLEIQEQINNTFKLILNHNQSSKDYFEILREKISTETKLKKIFRKINNMSLPSIISFSNNQILHPFSYNLISSYIFNTKKVVIFDIENLELTNYEISNLSFDFNKNSQTVS